MAVELHSMIPVCKHSGLLWLWGKIQLTSKNLFFRKDKSRWGLAVMLCNDVEKISAKALSNLSSAWKIFQWLDIFSKKANSTVFQFCSQFVTTINPNTSSPHKSRTDVDGKCIWGLPRLHEDAKIFLSQLRSSLADCHDALTPSQSTEFVA